MRVHVLRLLATFLLSYFPLLSVVFSSPLFSTKPLFVVSLDGCGLKRGKGEKGEIKQGKETKRDRERRERKEKKRQEQNGETKS